MSTPPPPARAHLAVVSPALLGGAVAPSHLPVPLTSLVGREGEIATLGALLRDRAVRLVTLTGVGGVGKTRLALRVAADLATEGHFADGVVFVDLESVRDPDLVVPVIAQALGARGGGQEAAGSDLKTLLGFKHLLLVLDNVEQVDDAGPVVVDLLRACPNLSVLVTSRSLLNVAGERAMPVAPLSLTSRGVEEHSSTPSDAVRLFVERTRAVNPAFALSAASEPIVAEIVRHLDGLPLAIELAAARGAVLSPTALLARLEHPLRHLTGGPEDHPTRHRTMRAAIAWSYELLSSEERRVFRCLGVFTGGCTLEAAESICAVAPTEESPSAEGGATALPIDAVLESLARQNLVRLVAPPEGGSVDGAPRIGMLETIRAFAAEALAAEGERVPARRHAEYYRALAAAAEPTFWGDAAGDRRAAVELEAANLQAAFDWAVGHGETDLALNLASARLDPHWTTGANAHLHRRWAQQALAMPGGSPVMRGRALTTAAWLAHVHDDFDEVRSLAGQALALARAEGDALGTAAAAFVVGVAAFHEGDLVAARRNLGDALAGFRRLNAPGRCAWTLSYLASLDSRDAIDEGGDPATLARAAALYEEALALFRGADHAHGVARALHGLAYVAYKQRDLPRALALSREVLLLDWEQRWPIYYHLEDIADIAGRAGHAATAARLYGAADRLRERAGRPVEPVFRDEFERDVAFAREALGDDAFAKAWAAGRALPPARAVAEADAFATASSLDRRAVRPAPLIGRARELGLLRDRLAAAADGRGSLVLIGGEAGIGKSTLVEAIGREAAAAFGLVLAGHCYDLTATPPYGPWRALAAAFGSPAPPAPLPAALTTAEGAPAIASQAALFAQVRDYFAELASAQPVVVVLEDLHWSDPASFDLLRAMTRQPGATPLLVVATYRADEVTRGHPLYHLLPILVREAGAVRLDVRPLEAEAIEAMVAERHRLPAADAARLVAYLHPRAEGNPLYVRELLRTLEEEGVLRPDGDDWVLGDLDRVRVPPLVQQVIDGRVARLGEETREPLAMAAVIGQDVSLDLWGAVSGLGEDALVATIERAVEANLLRASPRGAGVGFAHALVREALYEGILPPRRRIWHRRTAEALAAAPGSDPDAVAYHFEQAGDARAGEWLVQAGERAQHAYAWRTAAERFEAAATALEDVPEQERARGWLLYRIGRLLRRADAAKGVAYLEEAERIGRACDDSVLAAYALFDRGTILCIGGEIERGIAAMERGDAALDALPARAQSRAEVAPWIADALPAPHPTLTPTGDARAAPADVHPRRGTLVYWLALAGRFGEARAIAERYLAQVATVDDADEIVRSSAGDAHFGLGVVEACAGEPDAAAASFEQALAAYRAIGHHMLAAVTFDALLASVVLAYQTTRLAERRRLLAAVEAAYAQSRGALAAGLATRLSWAYEVRVLDGVWVQTRDDAQLARTHGDATDRFYATAALAHLACLQGDREAAWALIGEILPNGAATNPGGLRFGVALALIRHAAGLSLAADDMPDARAWIEMHDRWLAWSGSFRWQAEGRLLWAQLHRAAGDADAAVRDVTEALKRAMAPAQPLAQLASHRLLGALAIDGRRWDDAERELGAALALADACGAPFERALTLLAQAELRAATGAHGDAAALLDEVRAICTPLEARPTLARVDALAARLAEPAPIRRPAGLSEREVEVLRLTARGMTNAEIANELSISPRTVQQHLTNLYGKLAVSSRAGATRFAVEHGLA